MAWSLEEVVVKTLSLGAVAVQGVVDLFSPLPFSTAFSKDFPIPGCPNPGACREFSCAGDCSEASEAEGRMAECDGHMLAEPLDYADHTAADYAIMGRTMCPCDGQLLRMCILSECPNAPRFGPETTTHLVHQHRGRAWVGRDEWVYTADAVGFAWLGCKDGHAPIWIDPQDDTSHYGPFTESSSLAVALAAEKSPPPDAVGGEGPGSDSDIPSSPEPGRSKTDVYVSIHDVLADHEYRDGFETDCVCGEPSIFTPYDWRRHVSPLIAEAVNPSAPLVETGQDMGGKAFSAAELFPQHRKTQR